MTSFVLLLLAIWAAAGIAEHSADCLARRRWHCTRGCWWRGRHDFLDLPIYRKKT